MGGRSGTGQVRRREQILNRAEIVSAARAWIGTPFHHQGTLKGVGCDCRGLVVGVAAELGIQSSVETNYGRYPTGNKLIEICDLHMLRISIDAMHPGDVVAMTFERDPQHVAVLGDYLDGGLSLIHALATRGVVEHRLDPLWRGRIRQAYRLPGVE